MIGKTVGHYHIVEKIGSGGMGEVFRARDTKLNRDVALKILPAEMARDPERRRRFEREAQAIAALKHVNIVTIHAVEEVDGIHFLVMELVDGKSIGALLPPHGFDLDRFFTLAIPLAEAIHQAHSKGITHRDLKPANVMIDADGTLKVLDFGLAKLFEQAPLEDEATMAFQNNATQEGLILGTVAYMSPEQAEGKAADHRSDIFSLGIVFYELISGERPFKGDTRISTISSILREEPTSVTDLRHHLPRHMGRIIKRCLAKDPERRYQTALDLRNDLLTLKEEIDSGELRVSSLGQPSEHAGNAATKGHIPWRWMAATAGVIALAFAAYYVGSGGAPRPETMLTSRPLTGRAGFESAGSWSPDGSFVAYSHSASGPTDIFVMSSAGGDPIHLVASDADDVTPRWSPDNRWIAFTSNRTGATAVYLVPPLGGAVKKLADTGLHGLSGINFAVLGATPWASNGHELLFSRRHAGQKTAIWSIDLESGTETQLTHPEPGVSDSQAAWSPDGSRIAFCRAEGDGSGLFIMAIGDEPRQALFDDHDNASPSWSPDGKHLVFSSDRGGTRDLWSVSIASGELRRLTSGTLDTDGPVVARDGRILYSDSSHQTDLYVQDLDTQEATRVTSHTQDNFESRFSPDDEWVAYSSSRTGNSEIWILGLETGVERQLTENPSYDFAPDWSPDGREIAFVSDRSGDPLLWLVSVDGGVPRQVGERRVRPPVRWSPDGRRIGFLSRDDDGIALWSLDPTSGESQRLLDGAVDFDWYLDGTRVIYSPAGAATGELRAANLQTGEEQTLLKEPHLEIAVSRDGSAVSYCSARSHFNMNLLVLRLELPTSSTSLPLPMASPQQITHGDGRWHVHNGAWSMNGRRVVYTRDTDTGDVHYLEGAF